MKIHLYWWQKKVNNFGDILGPYLVKKLNREAKVVHVKHPSMRRYKYFFSHYVTVGSIISEANKNSIVWGSGIIRKDQEIKGGHFLSVRGPYTRNRLLDLGFSCPERYGDPAILLSDLYNPKISKKYKIGVIPHYVDYKEVKSLSSDEILVINLSNSSVEEVINQILSCQIVISSSLHGIIVPHTYGIPAIWAKFSDKVAGDDVKFNDYFSSVELKNINPIELKASEMKPADMLKMTLTNFGSLPESKALKKCKDDLYKSCPFNKSASHRLSLELGTSLSVLNFFKH